MMSSSMTSPPPSWILPKGLRRHLESSLWDLEAILNPLLFMLIDGGIPLLPMETPYTTYSAWDREINISLFFCDVFVWKCGPRPRTSSRCYHGNKSAATFKKGIFVHPPDCLTTCKILRGLKIFISQDVWFLQRLVPNRPPTTIIPQRAGNRNSDDLNFKISKGSMPPDHPQMGTPLAAHLFEPPFSKSWIRLSMFSNFDLTANSLYQSRQQRIFSLFLTEWYSFFLLWACIFSYFFTEEFLPLVIFLHEQRYFHKLRVSSCEFLKVRNINKIWKSQENWAPPWAFTAKISPRDSLRSEIMTPSWFINFYFKISFSK